MNDTECDRLWSALDKANQYVEGLEERLLKLEGARPARQAGDYLPDPLPWTGNAKPWQGSREQLSPETDASGMTKEQTARWLLDTLAEAKRSAQQLAQVRAILGDFLEPAGIPSPAQRIVLRIRAVVAGTDSVVEQRKGRDE